MVFLAILCFTLLLGPPAASQEKASNELKIVEALFEDYNGFTARRFEMRAGGSVVFSFQVEGFARQRVESRSGLREQRVHLRYGAELRDPNGILVEPEQEGEVDTIVGPRDEEWRPKINWSARVPSFAPSGDYRVHIRVTDLLARREASEIFSFSVQGESVQPSDTLAVQQLEYARSEEGPWFPSRYFSTADRIWTRYKIVGYRISPEKLVWVEQDLTLRDGQDNLLVAQPNASVSKQQSFYPPRFLSTVFELTLEDPKPGEYRLQINVRDRIGQQSDSHESQFFLRP